jgi:uncharacterized protein with FMN-binding domain
MAKDSRPRKVTPGLVALGSAAIMAVYATGYVRSAPTEASVLASATEAARQSLAATPLALSTPAANAAAAASAAAAAPAAPAAQQPASAAAPATSSLNAPSAAAATKAPTSAPTPVPTPVKTATPQAAAGQYRDGTYSGSGTSRHGGITVSVVVSGGRIVSADITRCGTRYPCSYIEQLPSDVLSNQRVTSHYISGATDSSRAYMQAVSAALAQAS